MSSFFWVAQSQDKAKSATERLAPLTAVVVRVAQERTGWKAVTLVHYLLSKISEMG